ncbi:MAG: M23 family metallopeptidase [Clostridia bacterium]|nr:M23 family metallopeptidase [Clostridia bacterium]
MGYSIIIKDKNFQIIYAHVSPNFIVKKQEKIKKGQKIGNVGPKYINTNDNTKYFDNSGKKTNGATTGTHLHITIKKDGKAVNPLDYL